MVAIVFLLAGPKVYRQCLNQKPGRRLWRDPPAMTFPWSRATRPPGLPRPPRRLPAVESPFEPPQRGQRVQQSVPRFGVEAAPAERRGGLRDEAADVAAVEFPPAAPRETDEQGGDARDERRGVRRARAD